MDVIGCLGPSKQPEICLVLAPLCLASVDGVVTLFVVCMLLGSENASRENEDGTHGNKNGGRHQDIFFKIFDRVQINITSCE